MKNLFSVGGKVVLVTGGSRGIGEMIARGFVENGAKVYISARHAEACQQLANSLSEHGTCIALPADLSTRQGLESLVAEIKAREKKLNVLVNNAGANWAAPLDDYPEAGWDKVVTLNLKSNFFLTQKLLFALEAAASETDPARVINIASIDGIRPPGLETYAYAASKSGLIHLTKTLGRHLANKNINVNAIAPGPFPSKMMAATLERAGDLIRKQNPKGRIGEPEDIAGAAIYLSSRASAWVTGVVIPVDGGMVGVR